MAVGSDRRPRDCSRLGASSRAAELPGLIGRRLLEEASDLRCADITDTTAAGGEPAELLAAWVQEHLPASDGALLPGVLDDAPIYERRAVSTADAEALMAGRDTQAQPYLVFSASHGMEVLSASTLAARCESGWRGIIVASANDLPAWMIEPWAERIATAQHLAASAPDAYHGIAEPQAPEDALFGARLGMQAGEQALADWHAVPRKRARDIEGDLRILAIARTATDLRTLGDRDSSRPQPVTPAVWHALLAYRQLDLSPFRSRDDDEHALRQGGLGLPLAVLAPVQVYTTNSDPGYEKGHGPHCQHARGSAMALHRAYDLLTAEDLLRRGDYGWCSKCGGYAIRRLNEIQLAYYRAAHRLHEIHKLLQWYTRDSYSHTPNRADTIHSLPSVLNELAGLSPDPDASPHNADNWRWREAVRLFQTEAQRVIAANRNASSATGSQADVVPLDRRRHTGKPGD